MHPLAVRVLRTVRDRALVAPGGRVIVALSGGSDSVALTYLLKEIEAEGTLALVGLAHLNHQLRGAAADQDERFCRALAERLSLPIEVERVDVAALARTQRTSIEDAGRAARYTFLARAQDHLRADRTAVGQTRDDQAETFILRLLRGAGPRGLAGILPQAGTVVRPLIDRSRAELRAYLDERGVPFQEDASNLDVAVPRNRVRLELIPYIQQHLTPGVVEVLAREAAIAAEDAEWLDRVAEEAAGDIVSRKAGRIQLDARALAELPRAIGRRVARQAMQEVAGDRFLGFDHVRAVLELAAADRASGAIDLPGHRAIRRGDSLALIPRGRGRTDGPSEPGSVKYPLAVPGEVEVPELDVTISAELASRDGHADAWSAPRSEVVAVSAAALAAPLAVRTRRPGDRFRPLGLAGHKKLQDLLVDRKVPREERDRVPIVVDRQDRIVWVVGQTVAEDFRVTSATQAVIILRVKRL